MKLAIITQVSHQEQDGRFFSYGPYVREINLWTKNVEEVLLVAPLENGAPGKIDLPYAHDNISFQQIPAVNLLGWKNALLALWHLPVICWRIFTAMRAADHIHLRCPGNIGLLGCVIQILFPSKAKTAKYAGNWDPFAPQPWSYKLQRRILSNTFLTRNMSVLVYGNWPAQSQNIKPFFTATYHNQDKVAVAERDLSQIIRLIFVGTLAPGKRPLYVLALLEQLRKQGLNVQLDFFGEGKLRSHMEQFIAERGLEAAVVLHGNQPEPVVRKAYQQAHFMVLPSQSEGWPKVVAEAMFWGCIPVATPVSCVPDMLGNGSRGLLLTLQPELDARNLAALCADATLYSNMAHLGQEWSRAYTLDRFETEIQKLLQD